MGCGTCCLKCLLILFNVLFGLIGAVLLAAGAFVLASANETLKPFIDDALSSIPGLPDSFNLEDAKEIPVGGITLDVAALLNPIATFLLVVGAFLLLTSIFGGFGACCSNRIMLYVYAAIVILLIIIQLLIVILFFTGSLDGQIKGQLMDLLQNEYVGIDDYTLPSLLFNILMTRYKCCGLDSGEDIIVWANGESLSGDGGSPNDDVKAKVWNRERTISFDGVGSRVVYLRTPFACCKFNGEFPNLDPVDDQCALTASDINNNYNTGCWTPMWSDIGAFLIIIGGAAGGVILFQVLCAAAAIIIAVQMQKEQGTKA